MFTCIKNLFNPVVPTGRTISNIYYCEKYRKNGLWIGVIGTMETLKLGDYLNINMESNRKVRVIVTKFSKRFGLGVDNFGESYYNVTLKPIGYLDEILKEETNASL